MNFLDDFFFALRNGQIEKVIAQVLAIIALVASLGILPAMGSSTSDEVAPTTTPTTTVTTTPSTVPTTTPTTAPTPAPTTAPTTSTTPVPSVRLVALERVNRSLMDTGVSVALNGRVYENSLAVQRGGSTSFVEYNLSREYQTFTATVGIDDNARIAAQYGLVKFYVDGVLIREVRAELGDPVEVSIPLNQGLRLRIETASYKPDNTVLSNERGIVIGSPMVHR
ncbi:NPCBM/NEW2 domain protein [Corynebacterium faecale]|uniref:NPCBM/NEW2 domain-containing protein n=1 Tax=Corynebacterium faecale TaxID=1758466 RepID=UPI0025B3EBF5|nr:NPCBM/NEW2 domain-containing protein [Corynebacterium faecale]WJY90977.1 NPCBM/NEW2 domain protein [Corynebacterium faecale]